jgi:hypothetical protein
VQPGVSSRHGTVARCATVTAALNDGEPSPPRSGAVGLVHPGVRGGATVMRPWTARVPLRALLVRRLRSSWRSGPRGPEDRSRERSRKRRLRRDHVDRHGAVGVAPRRSTLAPEPAAAVALAVAGRRNCAISLKTASEQPPAACRVASSDHAPRSDPRPQKTAWRQGRAYGHVRWLPRPTERDRMLPPLPLPARSEAAAPACIGRA